jgi:enoyl-CoA hydratase/carnithine racemase
LKNEILFIEKKRSICTLFLNRPEKKNSLSPELVQLLLTTLKKLSGDDSIRTLIIRGTGDQAFCSGYDIGSLPTHADGGTPTAGMDRLALVESLFDTIIHFPWPVIAMLNGVAYGAGCELALCCDIRITSRDIRIGMPPAKLGIVYPFRGLKRFIQTIGLQATREMFFTGRTYKGPQLKQMGIVDHLVPREELTDFTNRMAEDIAQNAPLALKGTKQIINFILDTGKLENGDQIAAESITEAAFKSEDAAEGKRAFLEKRKPKFKGK